MGKVIAIRSGGQTGADRAALDAARKMGIPICGWCPKEGWAEDYPHPPGILTDYPELKETPLNNTAQRTVWNVRDADATLLVIPKGITSPGTELTEKAVTVFKKPSFIARDEADKEAVRNWISGLAGEIILNVACPRESEYKGIYDITYRLLISSIPKEAVT